MPCPNLTKHDPRSRYCGVETEKMTAWSVRRACRAGNTQFPLAPFRPNGNSRISALIRPWQAEVFVGMATVRHLRNNAPRYKRLSPSSEFPFLKWTLVARKPSIAAAQIQCQTTKNNHVKQQWLIDSFAQVSATLLTQHIIAHHQQNHRTRS